MSPDTRTTERSANHEGAQPTRRGLITHGGAMAAALGIAAATGGAAPLATIAALTDHSSNTRKEHGMTSTLNTTVDMLPGEAVHALEQELQGDLVRPGSPEYDQARQVWNAAIDRHPALIVRPLEVGDIIEAVNFARTNDRLLAVRGGGHGVGGHGTVDDGVVIDLSRMKRLDVDPANLTATADAGLTWGEFNAETQKAGLATPGPDVAAVGLGGLTLGGGFGWLSRKYGMTIDNLLSAEVVTADGQLLTASEQENSDLFWALRGGGGNFGIATRLQFRLHPVRDVVGGVIVYPMTRDVLHGYAAVSPAASDDVTTFTIVMLAPPLPAIPKSAHGSPIFMIVACYSGDPAGSETALAALRNLGGQKPLVDAVDRVPYPALFEFTAMGANRQPQAIRAGFMHELDEAAIEAILDAIANASSPFSKVALRGLGGAMGRVPNEATAFAHRDKALYFAINNAWEESDPQPDRHVAWTEDLWRTLAPRTAGAYTNFLGDEGPERVRAAYSPETFARLVAIKRRYDPANIFRLNANIEPA